MAGGVHPGADGGVEFIAGHPGMGQRHDVQQAVMMLSGEQRRHVAGEQRLDHRVGGERRLGGRTTPDFVKGIGRLERHRVFGPERSVVVEHCDAFGRGNIARTFRGDLADIGHNRLLRPGVMP